MQEAVLRCCLGLLAFEVQGPKPPAGMKTASVLLRVDSVATNSQKQRQVGALTACNARRL